MSNYIGPFTQSIIDGAVEEFRKPENIDKITKEVIYPMTNKIMNKLFPYYILITLLQLVIVTLLIFLLLKKPGQVKLNTT